MNGRHFLIATLSVIVLLTIAFAPTYTQQSGSYDPWLDYNEDGTIDANELHPLSQAYGSSGDPTKNVNVTNFPLDQQGNLKVSVEENPPQTYKDALEITLLDTSRLINNTEYGLPVGIPEAAQTDALYSFCFSPKETFSTVTWLVLDMIAYSPEGYISMKLYINEVFWFHYDYTTISDYPVHLYLDLPEPSVLASINPGINKLRMEYYAGTIRLLEITMLIEYEYQA